MASKIPRVFRRPAPDSFRVQERLTHFLRIPMTTDASRPSLKRSMQAVADDANIEFSSMTSIETIQLTLGQV